MKTLFTITATFVSTIGICYAVGKIDELQKINERQKTTIENYRSDKNLLKKTLRRTLDALHDHDPAAAHRIHRHLVNDIQFRNIVKGF